MPIIKRTDEKTLLKTFSDAEKTVGVTPDPVVAFPEAVNENTTTQGTITNMEANERYIISAHHGNILYSSGNTFEYIVGSIDGMFDLTDILSIRGIIYNKMPSSVVVNSITVINSTPDIPTPHFDITSPVYRNSINHVIIDTHNPLIESYLITSSLGVIVNVIDGTFDYVAPNNTSEGSLFDIITIIAQGVNMAESEEYSVTVEILNISEVTIIPTVDFPDIVLEETLVIGTITNHAAGITYAVVPSIGVVTNIINDTFNYTAPDIFVEQNASLSIIAHKTGAVDSDPLIDQFIITNIVTPNPTISLGSEVDEGTTINGIITNHTAGTTYTFSANYGSAEDNLDGTFTYTPGPVIIDTNESILTTATMSGDYPSTPVESNIIIRNIAQNTPTPILNFAGGNVTENSLFPILITNHVVGTTYDITIVEGTISNASGNTFDYNIPEISSPTLNDNLTIRAAYPGDIQSAALSVPIIINNSISITPTITAFPSSMYEGEIYSATISNHTPGTTYDIIATLGVISNITDGTFDYTAPSIDDDLTDTLRLYAYNPTDEASLPLVFSVNILRHWEYLGWPCVFSHHSNKHHSNPLADCATSPSAFLNELTLDTSLNKSNVLGTSIIITSSRVYLIGAYGYPLASSNLDYSLFDGSTFSSTLITAPETLATGVYAAASIMIKNKVYVIGGSNNDPNYKGVQVATINSSGHIGNFSMSDDLPIHLEDSRAVITKNRIYMIGGRTGNAPSQATANVYYATIDNDGNLGSWTQTFSLPSPRYEGGVFITKNRIYYVGGYDSDGNEMIMAYSTNINSIGAIGSWISSAQSFDMGSVYTMCSHDRVFFIRLVLGTITIICAYIDHGMISSWQAYTITIPNDYHISSGQLFVTTNKLYILGATGKVLMVDSFDGWDPRTDDSTATE